MSARTLLSIAGYLPLLRFDKAVARRELKWSGLGGNGKGFRAVAGWDEDAVTMAVEAARGVLESAPDRLTFASTSAPFTDRSHAGIVVDALHLDPGLDGIDVAHSRRAASSTLIRAFAGRGTELVLAGEKRAVLAGSAQSLDWGDGAGAALVGEGEGIARLLATAAVNADLLDNYTSAERGTPYGTEGRFVRDESVALYAPVIAEALERAGLRGEDIALVALPEPVAGVYRGLGRATGLSAPNLCAEISTAAGDLGAAMPLFGLALALDRATPGDRILVAGFGNGVDVLIFEATGTGKGSARAALAEGAVLTSYSRFLNLTGGVALDWGPRAEVNQKVSASVLYRHGRDMQGFVGGRDPLRNVQFPKTDFPVNPDIETTVTYEDVVLRDVPAKVASITADRLNFTPDPPFYFGLVQFDNGARLMMEHCDNEGPTPEVGEPLRMRFRIKALDRQRGFRSYFWKAAPVSRPVLSEEV